MKEKPVYLAVDLGAESGRVIAGDLTHIEEIHRFTTRNVDIGGALFWDILNIFSEIKHGLSIAFSRFGASVKSIGIDTWGVDYVYLDEHGQILGNPYHYRDGRTDDAIGEFTSRYLSEDSIYKETGIQFMQLNTLFQVYKDQQTTPGKTESASRFLNLPDLLNYWLCGIQANEYTIASTTQMLNAREKDWSQTILTALDINADLFQKPQMPGTYLGKLKKSLQDDLGAPEEVQIVLVGSHDTASAVAAAPFEPDTSALFLSSGTWSLLGTLLDQPNLGKQSRDANFTNEGAVDGRIRYLKNIIGLWVLQECKRQWDREGLDLEYGEIAESTKSVPTGQFLIDLHDPVYFKPSKGSDTMISRIQNHCKNNNYPVPETPPEIAKCIFESLGKVYADTIESISKITGQQPKALNLIGGGGKNCVLCQITADACGIPVIAGPYEATALGNILIQELAGGTISSMEEGHNRIKSSFEIKTYNPQK